MTIEMTVAGQGGDAYLGWTPQLCTIKQTHGGLSSISVELKSVPVHAGGGQVQFFGTHPGTGHPTISLTLPANGTPVKFFAGGTVASIADQDASIIVTDHATGTVLHKHPLMVRIRKNANSLSAAERDRFLRAFVTLNQRAGIPNYQNFLDMHNAAANHEIHTTSSTNPRCSFLVWHRAYILDLERQLQGIDPSVSLPFWKFDAPAPNLFTDVFMGQDTGSGSLHFSASNPLNSWSIGGAIGVIRPPLFTVASSAANIPGAGPISNDAATLALGHDLLHFRALENNPHGYAHVSFGPAAPLTDITRAPRDPLFFLLHCNIDRIWALWQATNGRWDIHNTDTYPHQGAFAAGNPQTIGDYLDDTMWPWNGLAGGTRPPTAPGGLYTQHSFPSVPSAKPVVRDMIDYLGFNGGTGCFFDYEKLHFPVAKLPLSDELREIKVKSDSFMAQSDALLHNFSLSGKGVTKDVLSNMESINPSNKEVITRAFSLVKDKTGTTDLRLQALEKLTNFLFDSESAVKDLIDILQDEAEPVEIRRGALRSLNAISFTSPALMAQLPAFKHALRQLLNSKDPELLQTAIEKLASYLDETTQKKLLEGLENPNAALVPKHKAIQLLGIDPKAAFSPLLRRSLSVDEKPEVAKEAVIALSGDPESQEAIHQLLMDKKTDNKVRIAAMSALNAFNPEKLQPSLKTTITDPTESTELKMASLNILSLHQNLSSLISDKDFHKTVTAMSATGNEELKKVSDHLMTRLINNK